MNGWHLVAFLFWALLSMIFCAVGLWPFGVFAGLFAVRHAILEGVNTRGK